MIKETLAVIRRPRFGMYDGRGPYLADVAQLDGKTVWVDTSATGIIRYLRATGI